MDSRNTETGDIDEIQDFLETILFVIVVFREPVAETVAWTSLKSDITSLRCKTSLLIYDNSPASQRIPDFAFINIHYHHDPSNPGVAGAYNFGNQLAIKEGKRWLFLLDQDTQWIPGCLLQYHKAFTQHSDGLIFTAVIKDGNGTVSPFIQHGARGIRIKKVFHGPVLLNQYKAINSGLMIDNHAFQKAGGYEHSLPLDFSDFVFLQKFEKISRKIIVVDAELQHGLSGSFSQDQQKAMNRFEIYCQATRTMSRLTGRKILFWSRSLQRALHLGWNYRSVSFLIIYIKTWHRSV